jgi:rhomboid family GlyGly-CTERM serine protease
MLINARRFPSASLLLSLAAVLLYFAPGGAEWFQWDRSRPDELWRWVTAHWTHWSADHLCWDVIAFLLLGAACEMRDRRRFLVTILLSALLITPAVWLFNPSIEAYRGLSGIDSALFGLLAASMAREQISAKLWGAVATLALLIAGFVAKIGFETHSGTAMFVNSAEADFVPVPLAHVIGFVVGLIAGCPCLTVMRARLKLPWKCFRSRPWRWQRSPVS